MKSRPFLFWALFLLTAFNILIFFFKHHFQYQPYSTYEELYKKCDRDCQLKWGRFKNSYLQDELKEAKRILQDSLNFSTQLTQVEKIERISKFVYRLFQKHQGLPTLEFQIWSPLKQYHSLCLRNEGKLWCGNVAHIFAFFCWAEGIVTRNVEITQPGDHHVVNECYLENEGKWILADVPHQLVLIKNQDHQYLNLQDFRSALLKNETLLNYSETTNRINNLRNQYYAHYYIGDYPHYYYHVVNDGDIYSPKSKIKRYILPVSWYEVYDSSPQSNFPFHIKQAVLAIWLILLAVSVLLFVRKKSLT